MELKNQQNQPLLVESILMFQLESETMLNKLDITEVEDHLKESHKDTFLTEEAELEDKTDQENKVEEEVMSETFTMNSTEINTKNQHNKLQQLPQLNKYLKNNKNLRNHKNLLWLNIIKVKVLILMPLMSKKKLQLRDKLTLNGLRKKN